MRHLVSTSLVFNSLGSPFDKIRTALGFGYVLRNGRLFRLRSTVNVVEENVFDIVPESMAPSGVLDIETPFQWIEDVIPPGLDSVFSGSEFIDAGGNVIVPSSDSGTVFSLNPSLDEFTPIEGGPRNVVVEVGGGDTMIPQPTFPIVWTPRPMEDFRGRDIGTQTTVPEFQIDDVLEPPAQTNELVEPPPVFSDGGGNIAELSIPSVNLTTGDESGISESISFSPRLSVFCPTPGASARKYECRLEIPGLLARIEASGLDPRQVVHNLSDYEEFQPEISYLLMMRQFLRQAIDAKTVYEDFDFCVASGNTDNPHVADVAITPRYHFFDKSVEVNGFTSERQIPNFYFAGRLARDFADDVRPDLASGTDFSLILVSESGVETDQYNQYFSFRNSFPFGVEISADLMWSPVSALFAGESLLTQFGLNLADPERLLGPFVSGKNVVVGDGDAGSIQGIDVMSVGLWLRELYSKNARLYTQGDADASVFLFGHENTTRGADQNVLLKSAQAKRVLIGLERLALSDGRDFVQCLLGEKTHHEKLGFSVQKVEQDTGSVVHKIFVLHPGDDIKRLNLFDTQVFYEKNYFYRLLGTYFATSDRYMYSELDGSDLFDTENLAIYFSVDMSKEFVSMSVPEAQKDVSIQSLRPNSPSVSVEQYRESDSSTSAKVLFLLNNTSGAVDEVSANDDPIVRFEVVRLSEKPKSIEDFNNGLLIKVENSVKNGENIIYLDSNSFADEILFGREVFYIFRQVDIHGLVSDVDRIFSVRAEKFGGRYRLFSHDYEIDEFFSTEKATKFASAKRFVCVLPDEEFMKDNSTFYKRYKLKLVSKSSGREFSFNFGVKMAENREIG